MIKYPGIPKLATITDPFKGISTVVNTVELAYVFRKRFKSKIPPLIKGAILLPMRTAGPNHKVSLYGAPLDALTYAVKYPNLVGYIRTLSLFFESDLINLLEREIQIVKDLVSQGVQPTSFNDLKLGKLSKKEEPAGKVRVFAIADI